MFAQTISQIEVFWNLVKSSMQSDQKTQFSLSMKRFPLNGNFQIFSYSEKQWEK
jgi:hypothetical protein